MPIPGSWHEHSAYLVLGFRKMVLLGFWIIRIDQRGQEDLDEVKYGLDGRPPTIISTQSPTAYWLETLPDRGALDSQVSKF